MYKNIIFYTKEDGKNILIAAARSIDPERLMNPKNAEKRIKKGEEIIGHPLTNLYIMIDGKEFTFPKISPQL